MGEDCRINQHSNKGTTIGYHKGDIIAEQKVFTSRSFKTEADKCRGLIDWISPRDFSKAYVEIRSEAVKGTGQWFLESEHFTLWKDRKTQYLWVSGNPGAGKSFLSSTAVEEIRGKAGRQVAYLYLSYKEDPSVQDLLGNLAGQLIGQLIDSLPLPPFIQSVWSQENKKVKPFEAPPAFPQVLELLSSLVNDNTFIVLDAFDEFHVSQRDRLLNHLRGLPNVSLLVTSRNPAEAGFETIDIAAHQRDLRIYIDKKISDSHLKDLVDRDEGLRDLIPQKVTENAGGIFLLARLHVNALEACLTTSEVRETLKNLPSNRDEMYKTTLSRINKQDESRRQWAITTIGWIVHHNGDRPLEVDELRHGLHIGGKFDQELQAGAAAFDHGKLLLTKDILTICCGLVEIRSAQDKWTRKRYDSFRLIHYSTQEFFEKNKELFRDFHARISLACAKYLCLPRLVGSSPDPKDLYTDDSYQDGPNNYHSEFLVFKSLEEEYKRAKENSREHDLDPAMVHYFESRIGRDAEDGNGHQRTSFIPRHMRQMRQMRRSLIKSKFEENGNDYSSGRGVLKQLSPSLKWILYPLLNYVGSVFSHHVQEILDDKNRYIVDDQIGMFLQDERGEDLFTGISQNVYFGGRSSSWLALKAVYIGSAGLVERYLKCHKSSQQDLRPMLDDVICLTKIKGYHAILRAILGSNDLIDLTTEMGHTILLVFAQFGLHEELKQAITDMVTDLERCKAVQESDSRLMRIKGWILRNPRQSSPPIAHHFGDVKPTEVSDYIYLLSASVRNDAAAISDLQRKNCLLLLPQDLYTDWHNFRTKARLINTSLFLCVENCHVEAARVLLNGWFDVDIRDSKSQTLLHRAVSKNSQPMVELLLYHGARLDTQDRHGKTAWDMLYRPQHQVVKTLLKASTGNSSALRCAAGALVRNLREKFSESLEVAKSLIKGGLNPSIQTLSGETPLAVEIGLKIPRVEVVELMLDHGADPDIFLDKKKTLLDKALEVKENNFPRKKDFRYLFLLRDNLSIKDANRIVELLRKHGGKTAEEHGVMQCNDVASS